MTTKIKIRYRLSVALLLVALLCSACGARQAEPASSKPLLSLLAGIPQDPINQTDGFIYFVDYSAMDSAYNATRPTDAEVFRNARKSDLSYKVWWVVLQGLYDFIQGPWLVLETMPQTVGFSALEVDQAVYFGKTPVQGLILVGNFDADEIRTAYQTNFGLEPKDLDGKTVWCWAENCSDGARSDPEYRMRENPFGGNLGQRQSMIINDDLLMASADQDLVLVHLEAAAGTVPNLADDSSYLAAVNAVIKDADVLQAMIANPTVAQRVANKPPIDDRLPAEIRMGVLETLLVNFEELPPFELLILADAVTDDEQIARLGVVYKDADSAELAAPILLARLASHRPYTHSGLLALSEVLAKRNVTNPRYYVHQEMGRAVLVLEFAAPKATPEEIVSMLSIPYEGIATPPGLVYQLFVGLFHYDDTSWLSTASRAEYEAIQDTSKTIAIDAPDNYTVILIEGAGDNFTYYALKASPPENWENVSNRTLWICNEDERPSLIPEAIVRQIDGGGFLPGTQLNLTWSDQPGAPDSSELGISKIIVTIGITYEGCIKAALKAMENESTLLLTDTDSMFDGKDRLVGVELH